MHEDDAVRQISAAFDRVMSVNPETVVTSIIHVHSRKGDEIDTFFEEILTLLSTFEGFLKRDILSYEQPDGSLKHTVILTFQSYKTLRAWLLSIEREDVLAKYKQFSVDEAKIAQPDDVVEIEGVMHKPRKPAKARPPPKWKLFFVTELPAWLIVWAMTDSGLIRFMSDQVRRSFCVTTFFTMCLLVPPLVYAITPVMTHVLRPWLAAPRPLYKTEPCRTLDAGCGLFVPPAPAVDPEEVEELQERLNNMEAILRKFVVTQQGHHTQQQMKDQDKGSDQDEAMVMVRQFSKGTTASGATKRTDVRMTDVFKPRRQQEELSQLKLDLEQGGLCAPDLVKALPVTGVAHHHVKWDCEAAFIEACSKFRAVQREKFPGFLGMTTLHGRRDGLGYSQEFVNIWRYRSYEEMEVQYHSKERAEFLNSIKNMLESPSDIKFAQERTIMDSMTEIYVNPGEDAKALPPPLWKTTFAAILGLMMCAWPVNENFGPVLEDWGVEETWLRTLILTSINVGLNSWVCVPFVILLLGGWLNRQRDAQFNTFTDFLDRGFPYLWMKALASLVYAAILAALAVTKPFP